jgi:hypothetical protein
MPFRLLPIPPLGLFRAFLIAVTCVSIAHAQHQPCPAESPGKMLEPRQDASAESPNPSGAAPAAIFCGRAHVVLEAGGAVDLRLACEAVDDAVGFLVSHGLDSGQKVSLTIVDELPSRYELPALGQFDTRHGEIRVLSFARSLQACIDNPPFGVPMSSEIHRSFIVHEVIHALTHVAGTTVAPLKMEYVAYVGQFASMSEDLRERLIAMSGAEPFAKDEEISIDAYLLEPNRFGVRSWLHFHSAKDGSALLHRALER